MKNSIFWLKQAELLQWHQIPSFSYKKKNTIILTGIQMEKLIFLIIVLVKISKQVLEKKLQFTVLIKRNKLKVILMMQ